MLIDICRFSDTPLGYVYWGHFLAFLCHWKFSVDIPIRKILRSWWYRTYRKHHFRLKIGFLVGKLPDLTHEMPEWRFHRRQWANRPGRSPGCGRPATQNFYFLRGQRKHHFSRKSARKRLKNEFLKKMMFLVSAKLWCFFCPCVFREKWCFTFFLSEKWCFTFFPVCRSRARCFNYPESVEINLRFCSRRSGAFLKQAIFEFFWTGFWYVNWCEGFGFHVVRGKKKVMFYIFSGLPPLRYPRWITAGRFSEKMMFYIFFFGSAYLGLKWWLDQPKSRSIEKMMFLFVCVGRTQARWADRKMMFSFCF